MLCLDEAGRLALPLSSLVLIIDAKNTFLFIVL